MHDIYKYTLRVLVLIHFSFQIRKKNDVIRGLQADLRQIQKFSEDHIRRVKLEAEKQENTDKKNSDGRKQRLQQEITQLNTQLQSLTLENRESEQELRRVCIFILFPGKVYLKVKKKKIEGNVTDLV